MTKQRLYQLNDHFSSFSTALDFTKSNNLKFLKASSIERNMKSTDGIDFTQDNNTINSNRVGSDYETMLKTVNSFGSFNISGNCIPYSQKPQECSRIEKYQKNRIFYPQNCSSIEPVYSCSTLPLEKAKSYPVNQSRISQLSIPGSIVLSRESMNLTPQLQSPDVNINSSKTTQRKKGVSKSKHQMPLSRNHKNLLSKQKMQSTDGSQLFINSFVSNSSQSNLHHPVERQKAYPLHSFFPGGGRLKQKFQKVSRMCFGNVNYIIG